MSKEPIEYLRHIQDEISFILSAADKVSSKDEFINDETLKRAIVRSLEIIGKIIYPDHFSPIKTDHPRTVLTSRIINKYE